MKNLPDHGSLEPDADSASGEMIPNAGMLPGNVAEGAKTSLEAIMFTDIEGSVQLERELGTKQYADILVRHGELFYTALSSVASGRVEKHTGDGFMALFMSPSDAVAAALYFQWLLRNEAWPMPRPLRVRIGIHQGEIMLIDSPQRMPSAVGTPVNVAARLHAIAFAGQIVLTRGVFDAARQFVRAIPHVPPNEQAELNWQAHGSYLIKGLDEPVNVFEVGERGFAPFTPPKSGEDATRSVSAEEEATLGWRPAKGLEVARRPGWCLLERLGEGGFGEVWLAENRQTSEQRVFKFCFDALRLRSFRRELLLFRLIRERLGPRPDIAMLYEVQLEAPPYFLESEYCPGGTLKQWFEARNSTIGVPLPQRLQMIAQIARALAGAHSVGIIHKDVKPSNIFVEERNGAVWAKLADFGVGVLIEGVEATGLTISATAGEPTRTGTYLYTPPEYLIDQPASIQGDIYSLGVVLYQIVVADFLQPLGFGWQREIPDPLLAEDIATCVDRDPARRFSSALQLAEQIESLERRRELRTAAEAAAREAEEYRRVLETHRRRVRLAVGSSAVALVVISALVALALVLNHSRKEERDHARAFKEQRELAEDMFYVADMQTATDDMAQRRGEMTREIIQRQRPKPGERDRRGWEWFYVDSALNSPAWVRHVSTAPLRAIAVSPDEQHFAVGGDDGTVSLWRRDIIEVVRSLPSPSPVRALSWHSSGILAIGRGNGEISLMAAPLTGTETRHWQAHPGGVTALDWHPRAPELATGGVDGTLAWWREDGRLLQRAARPAPIHALAWRQDGEELAVLFGQPVQLTLANAEHLDEERVTALNIDESPLAWRPGKAEVAIAMLDWPMRSWNPEARNPSFSLPEHFSAGSSAFAWSPRADGLAVGGVDGKILLVDVPGLTERRMALYGHKGRVNALRWLGESEERLLSVGDDGTLRVWSDLRDSSHLTQAPLPEVVADAQWHPKDNQLAVLVAGDEIQILRGDTGSVLAAWPLPAPRQPRTEYHGGRIAWSPDGQWLAAASPGRPLALWNAAGEPVQIPGSSGEERDVQWMPDSRRLLVRNERDWSLLEIESKQRRGIAGSEGAIWVGGLEDDTVGVVLNSAGGARFRRQNVSDGKAALDLAVPAELRRVRRCALNSERTLLALGGETGAVAWINPRNGQWERPAIQHGGPVRALGWHPSGSRLASVGADAMCRIFSMRPRTQTWVVAHKLQSQTVATGWSADGRRLMIASAPRRLLRIYDASPSMDGRQNAEPQPSPTLAERIAKACAAIEARPEDEAGWRALEQHLSASTLGAPDAERNLLLSATRLGARFRFGSVARAAAPTEPLARFEGVALPLVLQVAQACALSEWPAVLRLSQEAAPRPEAAGWLTLAKAEALRQLDRRAESEEANLQYWIARRRWHGAHDAPQVASGAVSAESEPTAVDLGPWANIKLTEDWSGGENNSLSSVPPLVPQPDGFHFRCGDFLQVAGKTFRVTDGHMLPRETGWISFNREARRVSVMVAACYIEADVDYTDLCIGSLFLQRSDGRGAVRIPLVYGENVWDWWVPAGGQVADAPAEAMAWHGDTPRSRSQGKNAALFRVTWQAEPDAPPVVAASLVSHMRRPAPLVLAITAGNESLPAVAPGATSPTR